MLSRKEFTLMKHYFENKEKFGWEQVSYYVETQWGLFHKKKILRSAEARNGKMTYVRSLKDI
jgi:uncharacterized protein YjbK